jgi:hypothetical protein
MSNWKKVLTHSVINLTAAGTAQALSASELLVESFTVQGKVGNTGNIFVGDSGVSSTDFAIELDAGEKHTFKASEYAKGDAQIDLATVYFDGGTTDDDIVVSYLV